MLRHEEPTARGCPCRAESMQAVMIWGPALPRGSRNRVTRPGFSAGWLQIGRDRSAGSSIWVCLGFVPARLNTVRGTPETETPRRFPCLSCPTRGEGGRWGCIAVFALGASASRWAWASAGAGPELNQGVHGPCVVVGYLGPVGWPSWPTRLYPCCTLCRVSRCRLGPILASESRCPFRPS
jgi:hypothetical protein